ncbi:MAG: response regulator [Anaerolineae bacterium]|nr:response regulator [Anaerolineae bacterium]
MELFCTAGCFQVKSGKVRENNGMARILIVEDDDELRLLWEMFLKRAGHEVYQAVDGLEALYQARYYEPDLIVLDLMMPTASGDLVLGFVRSTAELRNTPVLVVSAHHNTASLAEQYEADAYLKKPFSVDDFDRAIKSVLKIA